MFQATPSQCSIRPRVENVVCPTDQQSEGPVQVTSLRKFSCFGLVLGDATIDQEKPSQCSVSVCCGKVVKAPYDPTAQQSDTELQVTALKSLGIDAVAFGEATVDQSAPFQCSISVSIRPLASLW